MIVSSLLILVTAAILLVTGMITGNNHMLVSSIAASLAAGVALYVGVRGRSANRPRVAERRVAADDTQELTRIKLDDTPTTELPIVPGQVVGGTSFEPTDYTIDRDPELRFEDVPPRRSRASAEKVGAHRDHSGADEPTEQRMSSVEAAALMRLDTEVVVVDGRPRFHHTTCVHLLGRDHEPLPVSEALELGFSPCALCEPVSRLLLSPVAGR